VREEMVSSSLAEEAASRLAPLTLAAASAAASPLVCEVGAEAHGEGGGGLAREIENVGDDKGGEVKKRGVVGGKQPRMKILQFQKERPRREEEEEENGEPEAEGKTQKAEGMNQETGKGKEEEEEEKEGDAEEERLRVGVWPRQGVVQQDGQGHSDSESEEAGGRESGREGTRENRERGQGKEGNGRMEEGGPEGRRGGVDESEHEERGNTNTRKNDLSKLLEAMEKEKKTLSRKERLRLSRHRLLKAEVCTVCIGVCVCV